jgi:hypothetical protein
MEIEDQTQQVQQKSQPPGRRERESDKTQPQKRLPGAEAEEEKMEIEEDQDPDREMDLRLREIREKFEQGPKRREAKAEQPEGLDSGSLARIMQRFGERARESSGGEAKDSRLEFLALVEIQAAQLAEELKSTLEPNLISSLKGNFKTGSYLVLILRQTIEYKTADPVRG